MEFRVLTARHMALVAELFFDVFSGEPWNDDWSDTEQLNAYIDDLTGQRSSLTLGYFDGDRLIAISLGNIKHWFTGTEYCIDEFCVAKGAQGKGIGAEFMGEIENYLISKGIRAIFLQTESDMPAYGFYRHMGFSELTGHVSFVKRLDPGGE